jgi:hypothetical protein
MASFHPEGMASEHWQPGMCSIGALGLQPKACWNAGLF